jgi:hypothetical protein
MCIFFLPILNTQSLHACMLFHRFHFFKTYLMNDENCCLKKTTKTTIKPDPLLLMFSFATDCQRQQDQSLRVVSPCPWVAEMPWPCSPEEQGSRWLEGQSHHVRLPRPWVVGKSCWPRWSLGLQWILGSQCRDLTESWLRYSTPKVCTQQKLNK